VESPTNNLLYPKQTHNPVLKRFKTPWDKFATPADGYTVVCTTYRLTEHYHYWTKNNPMNVQLIPRPFVEIPEEMASELGIKGGDSVKVSSIRATYVARAMVTKRIKPMTIDGKKVHQIGFHIHQGFRGIVEDEDKDARTLANLITPTVYDPNSYTPEFKGFLVKVEKA
jgi:formate dehydrogenase major subunit